VPIVRLKHKYAPYRLLTYVQFGLDDAIARSVDADGDVHISMQTGPIARAMRLRTGRLGDAVKWLEQYGLIRDLERWIGGCAFTVPAVQSWNASGLEPSAPDLDIGGAP
jgi:hypothetical protein